VEIFLAIRPVPDGPPLTYEAWCDLVEQRAEFVRPKPVVGKLPTTGDPLTIYPRPDGAAVVIAGQRVGGVHWSLSGDEDEVILSGDADFMLPLANELAELLGCRVEQLKA